MKIFENKGLFKKILIVLVAIILIEYSVPINISKADSDSEWGGVLFKPIQSFLLAIGDVGESLLNTFVMQEGKTIVTLSKKESWIDNIFFINGLITNPIKTELAFIGKKIVKKVSNELKDADFEDAIELPIISMSPEEIFSNQVPLLDVNILHPKEFKNDAGEKVESVVSTLQSTISSWYNVLRDIAIVAFLSVLVYIGIRILISSASGDKAKYKQMLTDWVVGLCLLFFMHYIMSFAMIFTEKITDLLNVNNEAIIISADNVNLGAFGQKNGNEDLIAKYNLDENEKQVDTLSWRTNLVGYVRFYAQTNVNSMPVALRMAYTIMYLVIVIYTYMFLFQYLKRVFNMVLLTLIAPVVAFAYPLDKVNDGHAQAFNMWLKEYIFNLLLQPMHLILYSVLMGTAINLVTDFPLYGLIVLGCLLQVEKLIRKMFGFDKSQISQSASSGAFTGAMVMKGVDAVVNRTKNKGLPSKGGGGSEKGSSGHDDRVRMAENRTANDSSTEDDFMRNALGGGSGSTDTESENPANDGGSDTTNPELDNGNAPLEQEQKDDVDKLTPGNSNYLHQKDPDKYDEYGNYMPRNGKDPQNRYNDSMIKDDTDKLTPGDANYFHQKDPDKYDEYGNYKPRDGKNIAIDGKDKQSKGKNTIIRNGSKAKLSSKAKQLRNSKGAKYAGAAVRLYAPKLAKTALKGAAMTAGAVTLGSIGVAAGLASDDFSNVLKYGSAAASGGALVGNIAANKAMSAPSAISAKMQQRRDELAREAYKDDPKGYKQYLNSQADKAFLSSKEIKRQYAEAFGESKAIQMMNNALQYRAHGITDNNLIIKTMKEDSGEIGKTSVTDNRRIAAAKLASGVSNGKDIKEMKERLKNQGYKDDIINQNEEFIRGVKGLKYN